MYVAFIGVEKATLVKLYSHSYQIYSQLQGAVAVAVAGCSVAKLHDRKVLLEAK